MTLPGLAGSFHFTARPVADLSKKVTSLLLFAAEKFDAVNDKLTKKALFPRGRAVFWKKCGSLAFLASSLRGSLRRL